MENLYIEYFPIKVKGSTGFTKQQSLWNITKKIIITFDQTSSDSELMVLLATWSSHYV